MTEHSFAFAFSTAFTLLGVDTSWIELVAVLLGFAMVLLTIAESHWGWPMAAASSALYFWLFWANRLYGDASLQIMFIALALWGWWLWRRDGAEDHLRISTQTSLQRTQTLFTGLVLWASVGWLLKSFTDTDVPWWDACPTAFSLVGQYLLARKRLENWAVWILVNTVAIGLFAWKGLWLTAALYGVFIALSVVGWRAWYVRMTSAQAL